MDEDVPISMFHWMDLCIKCDKGGTLLTCHQNGCPVVVHGDCLGSEAQFDEVGNFYCPFCVYRRATEEFTEAQRKAVLAEKDLSKYLDGEGLGTEAFEIVNVTESSDVGNRRVELAKDGHQMTGPGCIMRDHEADMNKESDVLLNKFGDDGRISDDFNRVKSAEKQNELEGGVSRHDDEWCSGGQLDQPKDVDMDRRCQSGDKIQNNAIQTDTASKQDHDAGHFEAHKIVKESVEAVEDSEETMDEVQYQEQAHKTSEKIMCKESALEVHMEAKREVGDTTASTCMDTNTISEKVKGAEAPCANAPRRTPCKPSKVANPPTIFTKLPTLKEKRKRLAWKVEEEEMLKKAVQKYSKTVNTKLPWQKILEEGRVVFDETRTPADLKDKWKNILSKEPLFEIS